MSIDPVGYRFVLELSVDDDDSSEKNDDELDIENQNQNLAEDRADDEDDESDDNEDEGMTLITLKCFLLVQFMQFPIQFPCIFSPFVR